MRRTAITALLAGAVAICLLFSANVEELVELKAAAHARVARLRALRSPPAPGTRGEQAPSPAEDSVDRGMTRLRALKAEILFERDRHEREMATLLGGGDNSASSAARAVAPPPPPPPPPPPLPPVPKKTAPGGLPLLRQVRKPHARTPPHP
jgi:hypothetical protein